MSIPHLQRLKLSSTPSKEVLEILKNEPNLVPGNNYVTVGLLGLDESILLVDGAGKIVELPYHYDDFFFL